MSQNSIYETPPEGPSPFLQQPSLDLNPVRNLSQEIYLEDDFRPTDNNIAIDNNLSLIHI